jgi:hypothetical protein
MPAKTAEEPRAIDAVAIEDLGKQPVEKPRKAAEKPPPKKKDGTPQTDLTTQADRDARKDVHACGLPCSMVGKHNRNDLTRYVKMHGVGSKDRKALEYNDFEREMYTLYSRVTGKVRVPKDHFTAALRLFQHGYSIVPPGTLDLNMIPVESFNHAPSNES